MKSAFVYALPVRGEDWLKLGRSSDPLRRALQFSPRWYELFDLDAAALIELESTREAGVVELRLRHRLAEHRAVEPLLVRSSAGGKTEWLRGAGTQVLGEMQDLAMLGHAIHLPARPWFRERLRPALAEVHPWTRGVWQACGLDPDQPGEERPPEHAARILRNQLDGFIALDLPIDDQLPPAVAHWYRIPHGKTFSAA
jgi:hypothetical protein